MACELCEQDGGKLIWRGPDCRIVQVDEPGYPGYCRAIWNAHVKEMTDLPARERERFMLVVFTLEQALRELLQPEKINLASLGNLTPHLHWHVIPRFLDDPGFPNPIWGTRVRQPGHSLQDGRDFADALLGKLSRL